jgi:hypothetical protein
MPCSRVLEHVEDLHRRVQPAFFWHVADPAPGRHRDRLTSPAHGAAVHRGHPDDGPHGGRLAGPVGPQEAEDLARRHGEGQPVQGLHLAVSFGQPVQLKLALPRHPVLTPSVALAGTCG